MKETVANADIPDDRLIFASFLLLFFLFFYCLLLKRSVESERETGRLRAATVADG